MAEKSALFISIARRCASRGEKGRAVVTIVNALRNNPAFIDEYPEAIALLADILELRFAEDVHRLEARYPSFGPKLVAALKNAGREDFAAEFEQSFANFCIDQMKDVHAGTPDNIQTIEYPGANIVCAQRTHTAEPCQPQIVSTAEFRTTQPQDTQYSWMIAAAHDEQAHEPVRHERKRETGDVSRAFGRIRTQTDNRPVAPEYADSATDRVIIDFDNCLNTSPKSAMFASGVTKIRTFAEELAAYQSQDQKKREFTTVQHDPLERLAETTHELSDTPSVEPYSVRHPLRFKLTAQHIVSCILLCGCVVLGLYMWHNATPFFEQRALQNVSDNYIVAADAGEQNPIDHLNTEDVPLVDPQWLDGYRMFLRVWQNEHFTGHEMEPVTPDSDASLNAYSSTQAAYITQEIYSNHIEQARRYYQSVPQSVWREHPYFHLWVQAMFDEADRDFHSASYKYEKLLHTPLAPFALAQMGLMALDMNQSQNEIAERFLYNYEQMPKVSMLATCTRNMLRHGAESGEVNQIQHLREPYLQYCAIGKIYNEIYKKSITSYDEYQMIKSSQPLQRGEYYRLEAVIGAALTLQNTAEAVRFYKSLELPEDHPVRIRLRNDIFDNDMQRGDWAGIHAMYPDLPESISYLAAARIIDQANAGIAVSRSLIQTPEALLKYQASATSNALVIDEAYAEAYLGHFDKALSITRSLLTNRPNDYEPLFLQAKILSQSGRAQEAAGILEQAMITGHAGAPFVVLSNLYRVRAGLKPNASAFVLNRISFTDPVLEAARCEIFWRNHQPNARSCILKLAENKNALSKSAWLMLAIDNIIKSDSTKWPKAGAGFMSTPGFHLAYARALLREDQFKAAVNQYGSAIIDDFSTSVPETVLELEQIYTKRKRRIEGSHTFESLTERAEEKKLRPDLLGTLHMSAARLYQPQAAHPMARKHLSRALDLLGETPDILSGLVEYYEAKDKPEQARKYRMRLSRLLRESDVQ